MIDDTLIENLDELLDITTEYLDSQNLSKYLPGNSEMDAKLIAEQIVLDINNGTLDKLPKDLDGELFKAYDLWDLVYYLKKRYNLDFREEVTYTYWLSNK